MATEHEDKDGISRLTVDAHMGEVWIDAKWTNGCESTVLIDLTPDQATELAMALLDAAGKARGWYL